MKKVCIAIIIVIVLILILIGIFYLVDSNRAANNEAPIFCIESVTAADGGTKIYLGLGYKVIKFNTLSGYKKTKIGPWSMQYEDFKNEITEFESQNEEDVFEVINYPVEGNTPEEIKQEVTCKIVLKDYEILFYGNTNFYMNYKGEKIDVKNSLIDKKITIDEVLKQAEQDYKDNIASKSDFLDGGSVQYIYDEFTIIKMNSFNGNKNVYIGNKDLNINNI